MTDVQVAARYSLKSREAIWKWVRNGAFPKPIKLSPGCTRWKLSEIEAWEAQKSAS
ncbi:AlpA family phage regulatory protein [uncultured Paracoccus sp.]|uniref:helix-turn-helix transcriptional regulator n=1 Tax=uncultured Paracoccus sp. TaxID=189685 RepID=UPI0030DC3731